MEMCSWLARSLRWEGCEERDMFKTGNGATITYLGKGIRVIGDVKGTDTLVCEGEIQGNIDVEGLVQIAPAGKVEGRLRAREAAIAGVVRGDIATQGRLKLQATCRVQGDVVAPKLVIEAGAVLDGEVRMPTEDAQATPDFPVSALPAGSLPV